MTNKEQIFKMIEGRIETMQNLAIESIELIYNAAIDDAIKIAEDADENSSKGYREIKEMKDDSLSDTQRQPLRQTEELFDKIASSVGKQLTPEFIEAVIKVDNMYAKEIWNAAIEAAASLVGPDKLQAEIRKLKK